MKDSEAMGYDDGSPPRIRRRQNLPEIRRLRPSIISIDRQCLIEVDPVPYFRLLTQMDPRGRRVLFSWKQEEELAQIFTAVPIPDNVDLIIRFCAVWETLGWRLLYPDPKEQTRGFVSGWKENHPHDSLRKVFERHGAPSGLAPLEELWYAFPLDGG